MLSRTLFVALLPVSLLLSSTAEAQPDEPPPAPPPADEAPADEDAHPADVPEPEPAEPAPVAPAGPAAVGAMTAPTSTSLEQSTTTAPSSTGLSFGPVVIGGYVQPQLRARQNDDRAQFDEDGFRVRRARISAKTHQRAGEVDVSAEVEAELTPDFLLQDAFLSAAGALRDGRWRVDLGQVKAPMSRQALLSDANLAFVDKAELAQLAPDRQIGARATVALPVVPWIRLSAGMFDGEGKNQPNNIDEHFLFAGRLEIVPIGRDVALAESAHGGRTVAVAVSAAQNTQDIGDGREDILSFGADAFVAWAGASASVEYLEVRHDFDADTTVQPPYHASGLAAQASYLLPLPGELRDRVEVGARFEEIDRNDTLQIEQAGDSNQSLRYVTGALSYYHRGHALKVQATYSHIVELEDRDRNGDDASYANDTLLVQATYRLE